MPRRKLVTAAQFREARVFSGLTREEAADFVGVSLRTIGHWETGKARPQFAAYKLLRVYRHGDLIDPRWSGYSIVRGKLVTPENHEFAPADLSWLSLLVRRSKAMSDLLRERDQLRARCGMAAGLPMCADAGIGESPGALARGRADCSVGQLGIGAVNRKGEYRGPMGHLINSGRLTALIGPSSNTGLNHLAAEVCP